MRAGFIHPNKLPYPYKSHPPLCINNGHVRRWKTGCRQVVAPTNGQALSLAINTTEAKREQLEREPAQFQPVDLSKDIFTVGELVSLDVKYIPFLLDRFIPKESITFLAGASDVGKSLFYSDLSLRIITDKKDFIGHKIDPTYGKVLLISTEDGAVAISNRIKKQLGDQKLLKKQMDRMMILTSSANLLVRVKQILSNYSVDLIILDAFGDVFEGDLNTSNKVRVYLNEFAELVKKHKTSMLIVHHIGKGKESLPASKNQLLGSVGIEGKARSVLMLSKDQADPSKRKLKIVKGNYVSDEDKRVSYELVFDPDTLTYSRSSIIVDDASPVVEKQKPGRKTDMEKVQIVLKLKREGLTGAVISKRTGIHAATVSRWLKKYRDDPGA